MLAMWGENGFRLAIDRVPDKMDKFLNLVSLTNWHLGKLAEISRRLARLRKLSED